MLTNRIQARYATPKSSGRNADRRHSDRVYHYAGILHRRRGSVAALSGRLRTGAPCRRGATPSPPILHGLELANFGLARKSQLFAVEFVFRGFPQHRPGKLSVCRLMVPVTASVRAVDRCPCRTVRVTMSCRCATYGMPHGRPPLATHPLPANPRT